MNWNRFHYWSLNDLRWDILQRPFLQTKTRIYIQKDFLESRMFIQNKDSFLKKSRTFIQKNHVFKIQNIHQKKYSLFEKRPYQPHAVSDAYQNSPLSLPTGWSFATAIFYIFLTGTKKQQNHITQSFLSTSYIDILIFWGLTMVRWKKSCLSRLCQNSVMAPYCKG